MVPFWACFASHRFKSATPTVIICRSCSRAPRSRFTAVLPMEVVAMLRTLLLSAAAVFAFVSRSLGAEGLVPSLEPESGLSSTEIARLIEQLDAPLFGERQDASRRLIEAGKSVLPDLEKAAAAPSREVSGRALDILKQHFHR